MSQLSEEIGKVSPMQTALDDLHNATGDVEHLLSQLHNRLSPVLSDSVERAERDVENPIRSARHIGSIAHVTERLLTMSGRLSEILKTLEV